MRRDGKVVSHRGIWEEHSRQRGTSAKALRHEHACACSRVGTPPRLERSCTQMLTDPKAGPGQQPSRSGLAGARSKRAKTVSQTPGYPYPRPQTPQGKTTEGQESSGTEMVKRRVKEGPKGGRVPKLQRGTEAVVGPI